MTHATGSTDAQKLPTLLLGIGFGGFADGIVLHQILQWHHMLTGTGVYPADTLAGLEMNMVADGFFQAAVWILLLVGTSATVQGWRRGRLAPTWRNHVGLLLAGWGVFNVVEGIVNHHILGIHHVRDDVGAPLSWDLGFLAFSVLLVAFGWLLQRTAARECSSGAVTK